jgi:5-methylthioadenosine/S-adenosylhomocysteine deaminase
VNGPPPFRSPVERLAAERPGAIRLARVVSLAARVEPELLRSARVRLLPDLDAGAEADLWFSSLVQSRTPLAIVLRPEVLDELREQLSTEPELLRGAWAVLDEAHRDASAVVRLEERVTFLALTDEPGSQTSIDELLQSAVWSMVEQDRRGIARWAARAFERLPQEVRRSEAGQMLDVGSRARLGARIVEEDLPADAGRWLPWVLPDDLPRLPVGVRLLEHGVELTDSAEVGTHRIDLPETDPLLLEVTWPEGGTTRTTRVTIALPLASQVVRTTAPEASLRTALGEVYRLAPRLRTPTGLVFGLRGRIVTMDHPGTVLEQGVLYVEGNTIVAVQPAEAPAPAGYGDADVVDVGGTIYPGLVELHNHLAYNALPMAHVPRRFSNRNQWARQVEYRRFVTTPSRVLEQGSDTIRTALLRYAEAKCLAAGVTTTQGWSTRLAGSQAPAVLRVADASREPELPRARTRIATIEPRDVLKFRETLDRSGCLLLHLAEGTDTSARNEFRALQLGIDSWALTSSMAAIHCTALDEPDFGILGQYGTSVVWSPVHDLMVYGAIMNVRAAQNAGVRIGLGASWSVTGSKNLLWELKWARFASTLQKSGLTDQDLATAVTRGGAEILGWDRLLGSLEVGKRADIVVLNGRRGSPYDGLVQAKEADIRLVVADGVPRYGEVALMKRFGRSTERRPVGGLDRAWDLQPDQAGSGSSWPSLTDAEAVLVNAFDRLPELAASPGEQSELAAAEDEADIHLATRGPASEEASGGSTTLGADLTPLRLDPLTVADDPTYFDRLRQQPNIPQSFKDELL